MTLDDALDVLRDCQHNGPGADWHLAVTVALLALHGGVNMEPEPPEEDEGFDAGVPSA